MHVEAHKLPSATWHHPFSLRLPEDLLGHQRVREVNSIPRSKAIQMARASSLKRVQVTPWRTDSALEARVAALEGK